MLRRAACRSTSFLTDGSGRSPAILIIVGLEFGEVSAASRIVYGLVGVSAVYQIVQQRAIRRRWSRDPRVVTA